MPGEEFSNLVSAKIAKGQIEKLISLKGARVLDVGCGDGALLSLLQFAGTDALGIEKNDNQVQKASSKDLNVETAVWPDFSGGPFDMVIFSRVLHHLKPIDAAVSKAKSLLNTGGFVFVDDFAFSLATKDAAQWAFEIINELTNKKILNPDMDEFVAEIYASKGDLAPWKKSYVKDLNSAKLMEKTLKNYFKNVTVRPVPYIYRYIIRCIPNDVDREKIAASIISDELTNWEIKPELLIGRQYVAGT